MRFVRYTLVCSLLAAGAAAMLYDCCLAAGGYKTDETLVGVIDLGFKTPVISPDGRHLAYTIEKDKKWGRLWIANRGRSSTR